MAWVVASSVVFALGGAFMKTSDGFARLWPSAAALAFFLVGAVLLTLAIHSDGLSTAYSLGLGVEALVSIGLGRYVFGEHLAGTQAVGVVLILAGVLAVRVG